MRETARHLRLSAFDQRRDRTILLCRRPGRRCQFHHSIRRVHAAGNARKSRRSLPASALGRFHDRAFLRLRYHEQNRCASPAQRLCGRFTPMLACGPLRLGRCPRVGDCLARFFSFDHVPDNFRAELKRPGAVHKTRIVSAGYGDNRRRHLPGDHGQDFRCLEYPACLCSSFSLSCLHILFRDVGISASRGRNLQSPLPVPATEAE